MEKIDTDYRQQICKIEAKLFNPFNRVVAPLMMHLLVVRTTEEIRCGTHIEHLVLSRA